MRSTGSHPKPRGEGRIAEVRTLPFQGGAAALVDGIANGRESAKAALFDTYAPGVRRVVARCLGADGELADLVQEVFVRALGNIESLDDPEKLEGWLTSIAVFVARGEIRRRKRRRWLRFFSPNEMPEPSHEVDTDSAEALRAVYRILDGIDGDDRIAFALRYFDGMEVAEVARAMRASPATVKRRIKRAQDRFVEAVDASSPLRTWVEQRTWGRR